MVGASGKMGFVVLQGLPLGRMRVFVHVHDGHDGHDDDDDDGGSDYWHPASMLFVVIAYPRYSNSDENSNIKQY